MCLKINGQTSVSVRELLKIAHITLLMESFICLPPVLCALFTFSFFPLLCYLFSAIAIFFCYFLYVKASYWNLLLFYLRRMNVVLSSCQSTVGYFFLSIFLRLSSWYFYFIESYINFILQDATKVLFFLYSLPYFFTPVLSIWVSFFFTDWKTDRNEIHFLKAGTLCTSCEMMLLFRKVQNGHAISILLKHYLRK